MRRLKLQMQMTIDGFVAGPEGQSDWIWASGPDEAGFTRIVELAKSCDTFLLGRKMAREFISHWENIFDNQPASPEYALAKQIVTSRKIVFSRKEKNIGGKNVEIENGDLRTAIEALKKLPGKDIMVYGGAGFVSSLISQNLIDEYYIIKNPVAIGSGMSVFNKQKLLKLDESTAYENGKILNKYLPF